jgi:hypothetical protein
VKKSIIRKTSCAMMSARGVQRVSIFLPIPMIQPIPGDTPFRPKPIVGVDSRDRRECRRLSRFSRQGKQIGKEKILRCAFAGVWRISAGFSAEKPPGRIILGFLPRSGSLAEIRRKAVEIRRPGKAMRRKGLPPMPVMAAKSPSHEDLGDLGIFPWTRSAGLIPAFL